MAPEQQLCTFHLDEHLFGVEVACVQEALRHQQVTPVPLAGPEVAGLINLRGNIVTAIHLRRCLDLPPAPAHLEPIHLIVCDRGTVLSLLVDRIGGVVSPSADAFEGPPGTLRGRPRDLILGAYKLPGALLLKLDLSKTLAP